LDVDGRVRGAAGDGEVTPGAIQAI
jgi:hypothetical protein